MYKIVPMTTNTVTNQITCFKLEGSNEGSVVPQGVLPNASLYEVSYQGRRKQKLIGHMDIIF